MNSRLLNLLLAQSEYFCLLRIYENYRSTNHYENLLENCQYNDIKRIRAQLKVKRKRVVKHGEA